MTEVLYQEGNLGFRPPVEEDLQDLLLVKNDQEAAALLGRTHGAYSEEDILSWIRFHRNRTDEVLFVVVDMESGHVVGHVGLYQIDRVSKKAEYGILLGNKKFRGHGVGQQATRFMLKHAFGPLGLHKVKVTVISDNLASYHMCLKCGFVEEGLMKEETFKNGRYYDVYLMSVINQ